MSNSGTTSSPLSSTPQNKNVDEDDGIVLDQKSIIIMSISAVLLLLIALPILYMWIKDYLDKRRARLHYQDCEGVIEVKKKSRPNSVTDSRIVDVDSDDNKVEGVRSLLQSPEKDKETNEEECKNEEEVELKKNEKFEENTNETTQENDDGKSETKVQQV